MVISSTLNRKLVRDLGAMGGRLVTIVGILALGISCFVAMNTAYRNLDRARQAYYEQCRMADFWIDLKRAPNRAADRVAELPGVLEVQSRLQFSVTVTIDGIVGPLNGLVVSHLADSATGNDLINEPVLTRGSTFSSGRRGEVIVNEAFAEANGLRPGDAIGLVFNDRLHKLRVVGLTVSSEHTYLLAPGSLVPTPEQFGVFYVPRAFLEEAFDYDGACNQLVGRLAPGFEDPAAIEALLDSAEERLANYGVLATTPREDQTSHLFLSSELRELRLFAVVIPAVFLGTAAMILHVLMRRLVARQRTTLGTLKALGYDNGQLVRHVLGFGWVVALLGVALGIALGHAMAEGLTSVYRNYFEFPDLRNEPAVVTYLIALALGMGVTTIAVWADARRVTQLRPSEAMRPEPPTDGRPIVLERFPALWDRLGATWRMGLRNLARNGRRTAFGVLATAMATALLVLGLMLNMAVRELIAFQFDHVMRSDVELSFRNPQADSVLREAERLDGVVRAEPVFQSACTFEHDGRSERGAVTGLLPHSRLTVPTDADHQRIPLPKTGLVVDRSFAEDLDLEAGDTVLVTPIEGRRLARPVQVAALVESYLGQSCYARIDEANRLAGEHRALTAIQVAVEPKSVRTDLGASLSGESAMDRPPLMEQLAERPVLSAVTDRQSLEENLRKLATESQSVALGMLIFFAGSIALGTALNAALISLAERRREIGTLLALGFTRRQAGDLIGLELGLINVLGTVIGLGLGWSAFLGLIASFQTEVFRIPAVPPWTAFVIATLLGLVFQTMARLLLQRSVDRIDINLVMKADF